MAKLPLRDARLRLICIGDPNSAANQKFRRAGFDIALAITRQFFDPNKASPGAFGGMPMGLVLNSCTIGGYFQNRLITGPFNVLSIAHTGTWEIAFLKNGDILPANKMISLRGAQWLAERIANSGLGKTIGELKDLYGAQHAKRFADSLGITMKE